MQGGGQPNFVLGNKDANNVISITYCGGWGYKSKADAFIQKVEKVLPGKFIYHYYREASMTGNFEVFAFFGTQTENDQGVHLYSKKATGQFPDDADALFETLSSQAKWVISHLRNHTFQIRA